jgi:hypothetical protein
MNRLASRTAPALLAAALACGCHRAAQSEEPAPPPREKTATVVARSVKPADDAATATRSFVATYGLTRRDLDAIGQVPGVAEVIPVRFLPSEVRYEERSANARVVATVAGYAELHRLELAAGRFLTAEDERAKRDACVLSAAAAEKFFPADDPLGKSVTIKNHEFAVVGVLKERPAGAGEACDVYLPLGTSFARFGEVVVTRAAGERRAERVELHEIVVRPAGGTDAAKLAESVRNTLEMIHPAKDWEVSPR